MTMRRSDVNLVRRTMLSGVLFGAAIGLGACKRADAPAPAKATEVVQPAATASATNVAKIKGRWLRPDGGYVLAITNIDADGRAEAGYFNPGPVRVAWSTVTAEGGETKVKVELRDTNYPGCLYKLTYLAEKDRLVGTYFQAQQQQTYEVEFVRER